jgi:hypothetical protein
MTIIVNFFALKCQAAAAFLARLPPDHRPANDTELRQKLPFTLVLGMGYRREKRKKKHDAGPYGSNYL